MNLRTVLVTGGARSGKSFFALSEASKIEGKRAFIATAQAIDYEMKKRIERHKIDRGPGWSTYEEPLKIAPLIERLKGSYSVILIDCLTLWLSNLVHIRANIESEVGGFISVLMQRNENSIFIVSNEVGMGIVPANELAREFRDAAGFLNQKVAALSDEVYMTVSGIPIKIKGGVL